MCCESDRGGACVWLSGPHEVEAGECSELDGTVVGWSREGLVGSTSQSARCSLGGKRDAGFPGGDKKQTRTGEEFPVHWVSAYQALHACWKGKHGSGVIKLWHREE